MPSRTIRKARPFARRPRPPIRPARGGAANSAVTTTHGQSVPVISRRARNKQHRVRAMNRHAHQVMTARPAFDVTVVFRLPDAKHLVIEHVRHPSQGMPVPGMRGVPCPFHALPIQALCDPGILVNVIVVVTNRETMPGSLHVQHGNKQHESETNPRSEPRAIYLQGG